jgi:hypothetical protein
VTDFRETARALWRQSRDRIVQQSDDAVAAAAAWSESGEAADLASLRSLAHQLTGALGTYAAALRSGAPEDESAERVAGAAAHLDAVAHADEPAPHDAVTAAQDLRRALDDMVD